MGRLIAGQPPAAAWHDVECGSYSADLPLWRELAEAAGGPVLDLGCGTGRVALDLAQSAAGVTGIDSDPDLVAALRDRARARDLEVEGVTADARSFSLGERFPLVICAMQVAQLLGGPAGRAAMLRCVHDHLEPGGLAAIALADPFEAVPAGDALPPLPDVLELDGWVLSSLPVAVRDEGGAVAIERVRQAVSPAGDLIDEHATILLDAASPAELEDEGVAAGLRPRPRRLVAPTADHVGSTIVCLERP